MNKPTEAHRLFEKSDPDAETREISRPPPPQNTLAPCPQKISEIKDHPRPTDLARQKWPEDAFVEWKREHRYVNVDGDCCDDDAAHCAFMSGIAYAEEHITKSVSSAPCPIKDEGEETGDLGKSEALADHAQAVLQNARKRHSLKTWPEFFKGLADGSKNFEVRKMDRDFRTGDELELHEFSPSNGFSDAKPLVRRVTYMLRGPAFGVANGWCVMALQPVLSENDQPALESASPALPLPLSEETKKDL